MVRSMTGFGEAEGKIEGGILHVEIRSFNHRFFEFTGRIPPELLIYEGEIKNYLKERIHRGAINLLFSYNRGGTEEKLVSIDLKLAKRYFELSKQLQQKLGLKDSHILEVKELLSLPGILVYEEEKVDLKEEWDACRKVLEKAVGNLLRAKEREGRELFKDILAHLKTIKESIKKIEKRVKRIIEEYKGRLCQRLKEVLGEEPSKERVEEEAALFLRNADISEELLRTKSHLVYMEEILKNEEEVGRKFDFVCQELYREANTMGAKGNDFTISKGVVIIKSEIEKIREQIQNLE